LEIVRSWVSPSTGERLFLAACVAVLYGGHVLYGGLTGEASLSMIIAWAVLLAGGALWASYRTELIKAVTLLPAGLFLLVLAVAAWSLTGATPDGAQPVWAAAGTPGSASIDRSATLLEIIRLAGLACVFLVGLGLGLAPATARVTLKSVAYAGAAFAALAIAIALGDLAPQTQAGRLEAMFRNPNTAGSVFGAILCLCAGLLLRTRQRPWLAAEWVGLAADVAAVAIVAAALLMTGSRGALAATGLALAALILLLAWQRRWPPIRLAGLLAAFGVAALGALAINGVALSRLWSLGADSSLRRLIFDTHWRSFLEAPWTGHGLGTFDTVNRARLTAESYAALWNIRSAENVYLQWLVEAGILGAVPMFLCVGLIVGTTGWLVLRRRSTPAVLLALLAADAVLLLHGVVDFALQTPSVAMMFAFLLGLQLAWAAALQPRKRP
jgi:O-antigen ligase